MTNNESGVLELSFVRSGSEKVVTVIALLVGLQMGFFAYRTAASAPFELSCERARDDCSLRGTSIYGKSFENHFELSSLKTSRVETISGNELRWVVVDAAGKIRPLGNPSGRAEQKAAYREQASALQRFLDQAEAPTFRATFRGLGGPSGPVFLLVPLLMFGLAASLIYGWRLRMSIDRSAGTVTVLRSPGGAQSFPLSRVARAEVKRGWIFLVFSLLPTVKLRLLDANEKVLVSRALLRNPKMIEETEAQAVSINEFIREAKKRQ